MFKRRKPRSYGQIATEMIYPRGGWRRAGTYVVHRLRRLPDQPQRIGRGVAAGVAVSFTPFFGFHFLAAAAVAWVMRGNILAALLATFVGNPATFPFIGVLCVTLGREIMGLPGDLPPHLIFVEFGRASAELWHNIKAIFGPDTTQWTQLSEFFHDVYIPYLVGGLIPGILCGALAHYLTVPVVQAYHRRRSKKMAERIERVKKAAEERDRHIREEALEKHRLDSGEGMSAAPGPTDRDQ